MTCGICWCAMKSLQLACFFLCLPSHVAQCHSFLCCCFFRVRGRAARELVHAVEIGVLLAQMVACFAVSSNIHSCIFFLSYSSQVSFLNSLFFTGYALVESQAAAAQQGSCRATESYDGGVRAFSQWTLLFMLQLPRLHLRCLHCSVSFCFVFAIRAGFCSV